MEKRFSENIERFAESVKLEITLGSCEHQGRVRPCRSRSLLKIGIGLKAVGDDDDFNDDGNDDDGNDDDGILHICHNHHNRWLCKKNQSSVKFSNGYVKETALILHKMCHFTQKCVIYTHSEVFIFTHRVFFTQCVILHSVQFYTQCEILHTVCNFTHKFSFTHK